MNDTRRKMTVIRLPGDIHQALKLAAVQRKTTMTKLVAEAIAAYIAPVAA